MPLTAEQHAERRTGIGGSEAAAACGLGRRMSARELYHVKRGDLTPETASDDDSAWIGHALEPMLARRYRDDTGRRVSLCKDTLRHPDLPFLLAHPDRLVYQNRILELKVRFSTDGWGPAGSDNVPDEEMLQCMHYLAVTGRPFADLQCIFSGVEFRRYTLPRDETLIDNLISAESDFWTRVEAGDPPPLDFEHPSTPRLVRELYPGTDGRFLIAGQDVDESIVHWHEVLAEASARAGEYERAAELARAHILAEMRTAARLMLPDGSCYERRRVSRKGFTVEPTAYVTLQRRAAPREVRL